MLQYNQLEFSNGCSEQLFGTGSNDTSYRTEETELSNFTAASSGYISMNELELSSGTSLSLSGHLKPSSSANYGLGASATPAAQRNESEYPGNVQDISNEFPSVILTDTQEETLQFWRRRCEAQQRFPQDWEIASIAGLEQLSPDLVRSWFGIFLQQHASSTPPPLPVAGAGDKLVDSVNREHELLLDIRRHARSRFEKDCASSQSKKAPSNLLFQCTSGCGYTTSERDAWQRHEQLWQPQRFWHCKLCRNLKKKAFICSRKDKFRDHLRQDHRNVPESDYDKQRSASKVEFAAGLEERRKFFNQNGPCGYRFQTWEDRVEHYLQHFNNIKDGPWQLRFSRDKWFDDGDDDHSGSSSSISYGGSNPAPRGSGNGKATHISTGGSYDRRRECSNSQSALSKCMNSLDETTEALWSNAFTEPIDVPLTKHLSLGCYDSDPELPLLLIDVQLECLTRPCQRTKYLALDCSLLLEFYSQGTNVSVTICEGPQLTSSHIEHLPRPFEEAVCLTKEMGYRYLWIEDLCGSKHGIDRASKVFEHAVLTIVLVERGESQDAISHFTCHYKNLTQIRSWALDSISFLHIQNLGHGAYGIVDQVQLLSTHRSFERQSFARKVLLGSKTHKRLRLVQFHEVEIMQKLHHPNVAQFVAAYFHRRSLNILMTPVADCDLREFLAEPWRWPKSRPYLDGWFEPLASALAYMHASLCRHKDIKPANILISGHTALLSDFGTSEDFSPTDSGSHGAALMTPKYCAPEVAAGKRRGRMADIWSLGCVFAEMITVVLGRSIDDLHSYLGFKESNDRYATYYRSSKGLSLWLRLLSNQASSRFHGMIARICEQMLQRDPSARPSACKVHHVLIASAAYYGNPNPLKVTRMTSSEHSGVATQSSALSTITGPDGLPPLSVSGFADSIRIGLMVGIVGGAPSRKHDVRLGDVVVGLPTVRTDGVIHYEFGKTIQNQKLEQTGPLGVPPLMLLTALNVVGAGYERKLHRIAEAVRRMVEQNPPLRKNYGYSVAAMDQLYDSAFVHSDRERSCEEVYRKDAAMVITRPARPSDEDNPLIHYGLIASADRLMKDAQIRDTSAREQGVLCFEMEAAGLMDHLPCVVVRGICDYSDSHKNDICQGYAAATAAAYAKELLEVIRPTEVRHLPPGIKISQQSESTSENIKVDFPPQCRTSLTICSREEWHSTTTARCRIKGVSSISLAIWSSISTASTILEPFRHLGSSLAPRN